MVIFPFHVFPYTIPNLLAECRFEKLLSLALYSVAIRRKNFVSSDMYGSTQRSLTLYTYEALSGAHMRDHWIRKKNNTTHTHTHFIVLKIEKLQKPIAPTTFPKYTKIKTKSNVSTKFIIKYMNKYVVGE